MADHNGEHTPMGAAPPNHLGTDVPSGHFDGNGGDPEKELHQNDTPAPYNERRKPGEDEEEEEVDDIDGLIAELESADGQGGHVEDEEDVEAGEERPIAEEYLQTNVGIGLSANEVLARRKKFGVNRMKEEKENLILKFLGYFIGPIQFVMEVSAVQIIAQAFDVTTLSHSTLAHPIPLRTIASKTFLLRRLTLILLL